MGRSRPTSRPVPAVQPPAVAQANALRSLLAAELVGAIQVGREYPGRHMLTDDELAAHFAGDLAIAIRVGNGRGRSRHLVIDIDARATERIPHVLQELRRRGYGDATLVTDGSSPDRGKVVVFFRSEQQGGALRQLAADVLREPRTFFSWGIESPGEVSVYPQRGEGGLARIGGRNIGRNGPLERFWNAWGEPGDLEVVAPSPTRLRPVQDPRKPVRTSPRQGWVDRLMREGTTWIAAGGTRGLNAMVNRIAYETVRTHGAGDAGRTEYARVLATIATASPDLLRPSPKNADRRHPLSWGRRASSAWEHVCEQFTAVNTTFSAPPGDVVLTAVIVRAAPGTRFLSQPSGSHGVSVGVPFGVTETSTTPPRAARNGRPSHLVAEIVALLATIVDRRGLNPLAFEVSYRELGAMLGISHVAARKRILRAEDLGRVVRTDPGLEGSGGRYTGRPGGGAKTLYALVAAGETADAVRRRAEKHHSFPRRRAFAEIEQQRRAALRAERSAKKLVPFPFASQPADVSASDLLAYAVAKLSAPDVTTQAAGVMHLKPNVAPAGSPTNRTVAYIQARIRTIVEEQDQRERPP